MQEELHVKIPDVKHTYSSQKKEKSNTNDLMNVNGKETESFGVQG